MKAKDEHELPEAARRAFEEYPHIEPSPAFNRSVLESLASAQSQRRHSLVGRLEDFLGVGLWSFAASGMLGAFVPAVVLSTLILSGRPAPPPGHSDPSNTPMGWPGFSPFGEVYRREYQMV